MYSPYVTSLISIFFFFFLEEHALKGQLLLSSLPAFPSGLGFVYHNNWRHIICSLCYIDFSGTSWCFSSFFSLWAWYWGNLNQAQFLLFRGSRSGRPDSPRGQATTVQFDKRDRYKAGQWHRCKCSTWVQRMEGRREILPWGDL